MICWTLHVFLEGDTKTRRYQRAEQTRKEVKGGLLTSGEFTDRLMTHIIVRKWILHDMGPLIRLLCFLSYCLFFPFFCLHLSVAHFSHLTARCFLILSFPIFCIIPTSTPPPPPLHMQGAGCRKLPFPAEGRLRVHHGLSRMSWLLPTPLKLPGNSFVCCVCSRLSWMVDSINVKSMLS